MAANWYEQKIQNNNYLSPIGFKFTIEKAPKSSYLCQTASIPQIDVGDVRIDTPFLKYPIEGNFRYGNLDLQFLIDENLENYLEIHNWMRAMGVPERFRERAAFEDATNITWLRDIFSDGTLEVLTNSLTNNFKVVFMSMFPTSLTTIDFDATVSDNSFMTATVSFAYTRYEIRTMTNERRTMSDWNPTGT